MAQLVNGIWNAVASARSKLTMEGTEGLVISEREPGEDLTAYSSKKLTEIAALFLAKSKGLTLESVRECVLSSVEEFNHAHFYMLVQFGILVYYPSIAMSIINQQYEQETDDMMEQELQPQSQLQSQSEQECVQQQIISQLIELIQSMIQMQKQQQQQQQYQQEQQGKQQHAAKRQAMAMRGTVPMKKNNDDDNKMRLIVRPEGGQGGQGGREGLKILVWTTVFIQI